MKGERQDSLLCSNISFMDTGTHLQTRHDISTPNCALSRHASTRVPPHRHPYSTEVRSSHRHLHTSFVCHSKRHCYSSGRNAHAIMIVLIAIVCSNGVIVSQINGFVACIDLVGRSGNSRALRSGANKVLFDEAPCAVNGGEAGTDLSLSFVLLSWYHASWWWLFCV